MIFLPNSFIFMLDGAGLTSYPESIPGFFLGSLATGPPVGFACIPCQWKGAPRVRGWVDGRIRSATIVGMNTIHQTSEFAFWLAGLKDSGARARVTDRVLRAVGGNFGDCASVGDGVSEMRIHSGPGYRIYFTRRGAVVYLLLIGGDKSTQIKDIARAKAMLATLPEE